MFAVYLLFIFFYVLLCESGVLVLEVFTLIFTT